jgi:hypothetical protein
MGFHRGKHVFRHRPRSVPSVEAPATSAVTSEKAGRYGHTMTNVTHLVVQSDRARPAAHPSGGPKVGCSSTAMSLDVMRSRT